MHNLLTEEAQKKVINEYRFRFLALLCGFFAAVFLTGTILLLPSYFYIFSQKGDLQTALEAARKTQQENGDTNFSLSARSVEDKIKILASFNVKKDQPDSLFNKIIEEKGSTISLQHFIYNDSGDKLVLTVEGVAKTRDDLLAFRNRLRRKAPFTAADFPVELLAKDQDIRFSMTVQ